MIPITVRSLLMQIPYNEPLLWLGLLAAVLGVAVLLRRSLTRRRASAPAPPPSVAAEIIALTNELSQTARTITDQLDSRAAALRELLKEADEKIALLRDTPTPPEAASERTCEEADSPRDSRPPHDPHFPLSNPANIFHTPSPSDPRHADVYTLADQGRSSIEIARHLNRPSGEVELILALRPRS